MYTTEKRIEMTNVNINHLYNSDFKLKAISLNIPYWIYLFDIMKAYDA